MINRFQGTALRVVLALLIGLMSASFGTALAEETGNSAVSVEGSPEIETNQPPIDEGDGSTDTDIDTDTSKDATVPEDDGSTPTDETGDVDTDTTTDETVDTSTDSTPDEAVDTDTDASTEESVGAEDSSSNSRSISPMALTPDGQMIAPDDLGIGVPENRQFKDLATVSVTLTDIAEGTCTGGSPRFALGLSSEADGTTDGYAFVQLADAGSFVGCTNAYALEGANLVGTPEARWETSQLVNSGNTYMSWDQARTNVGNYYVTEAMLVLDVAPGSLTPIAPTVAFNVAGEPGDLLGKLEIGFSVTGGTPAGDICFDVVNDDTTESVAAPCFDSANLVDGSGSLVVDRLPAGAYTVTQTETPAGFTTPAPSSLTVVAGQNHYAQFNSVLIPTQSMVTIEISSANANVTAMPAGSTWTVSDGTLELSGTFTEEHLTLPVSIPVETALPVGEYSITIHAEPTFETYTALVTLSEANQTVSVTLEPDSDAIVDAIVRVLIQILEDILAGTGGE